MKIDNTPVSDNVVRIIKEKGYKQCAIARKAGYSRQVDAGDLFTPINQGA